MISRYNTFPVITDDVHYREVRVVVSSYLNSIPTIGLAKAFRDLYALQRIEEYEVTHHIPTVNTFTALYFPSELVTKKTMMQRFLELFKWQ